jgi:hypothetical protein
VCTHIADELSAGLLLKSDQFHQHFRTNPEQEALVFLALPLQPWWHEEFIMAKYLTFLILACLISTTGFAEEQKTAQLNDEATIRALLHVYPYLLGIQHEFYDNESSVMDYEQLTPEHQEKILRLFHSQYGKVLGLQHTFSGREGSVMDFPAGE